MAIRIGLESFLAFNLFEMLRNIMVGPLQQLGLEKFRFSLTSRVVSRGVSSSPLLSEYMTTSPEDIVPCTCNSEPKRIAADKKEAVALRIFLI